MDAFNKLVPLNSEKIKSYLKNLRGDQLNSSDILNQSLDLAKEFRSKDYPLIHLLLQNPLSELMSMAVPNPSQEATNLTSDNIPGYLYLFDGRVPIERRRADDVQWNDSKKMSVKLIIYNENTGLYKLKNNKNDEGAVVMRRQTWRADGSDKGWRRNEYKLVVKETYFKQAQDGRLSVTEGQTLQEFPVLVHYFWKKEASGHPRKKRKRDGKDKSRDPTPSPSRQSLSDDPSSENALSGSGRSTSLLEVRGYAEESRARDDDDNDIEELEASPDMKAAFARQQQQQLHAASSSSSGSSSGSSTSGGSYSMRTGSFSNSAPSPDISILSPLGSMPMPSPALRYTVKSEPDSSDDLTIIPPDILHFTSRMENGALVPFTPLPTTTTEGSTSSSSPKTAEIKCYAPESGPATEHTKMLLVYSGFQFDKAKKYRFSCLFEEVAIPATEVGVGVLQCQVPPHKPGIVYFWLACVEEGREEDDPKDEAKAQDPDSVQYSQPVPFYYTPNDMPCRLSLAWELVGQSDVAAVMRHFKYATRELDLSNNNLTNVDFLEGFRELHTLILDNNHITHDAKFPSLTKLRTLSINHNWLIEIDKFMDNLVEAAPNLRYLSTLHNAACPFFSNAKHHYYNYRIYIVSRLRKLTHLDSSPVTMEEWRHAACIIPSNSDAASANATANDLVEEFTLGDEVNEL